MKYIDADRLKAEIEKHIKEVKDAVGRFTPNLGFFDAKLSGIYDTLSIINSLQQEQPVGGLEYEIKQYFDGWSDDTEYGQAVTEKGVCVGIEDCEDIARHFAEWGADHLAGVRKMVEPQKEPNYTKRNALFDQCVANCDPKVMKEVSDKVDEMNEREELEKLVNEEFASHSRTTEYGLEVTYNRAELYQLIKRMALVFNAKKGGII